MNYVYLFASWRSRLVIEVDGGVRDLADVALRNSHRENLPAEAGS